MFKLIRGPVLAVALAVSLWLPHGSQHTGALSPASTCKFPRDLTSLVWHRELAERREAVKVASAEWLLLQLCPVHIKRIHSWQGFNASRPHGPG